MAFSEVAGEDVVALFMRTTVREIITTRLTRITSSSPSILIFTSCLSFLVTFYCCKNLVYFNCYDGICLLLPSEINYCELIQPAEILCALSLLNQLRVLPTQSRLAEIE